MSFLLSNCNELSFDGLVAVNGGCDNKVGYFLGSPIQGKAPCVSVSISGSCPGTVQIASTTGSGSPTSYPLSSTQNPPKQSTGYTATAVSKAGPQSLFIDVNKLREVYY